MSSVLCYDIHICDLVFLVTLSKRMTKRQYVIKTKTIVSVLTFLRSSQGIVGWGVVVDRWMEEQTNETGGRCF